MHWQQAVWGFFSVSKGPRGCCTLLLPDWDAFLRHARPFNAHIHD